MTKLNIEEIKDFGKDVVEAWKLEGKDIGGIAQVLFYPINMTVNPNAVKPSDEEIKEAIRSLIDIPRVAPLIVIFVSSPIPGSSLFYLSTLKILEKITGNRVKMIPRRFRKIIENRLNIPTS
jgi:hypothetical protein